MAETLNFSKQALLDLAPAMAGKVYEVRDANTPGLILRITPAGGKTFYFYRWTQGKAKRHLIGKFPDLTIELARRQARQMTGTVAAGEDPSDKPRRDGGTLGEMFTWWEEHHGARRKSVDDARAMFDLYCKPLAGRQLADITRADMRDLHTAVGKRGQVAANRLLSLLRNVINRAIEDEAFDGTNPAEHIKPYPEQSRDRRLTRQEATALFEALEATDGQQLRDFIYLLLFTGARKGNLMAMRWDEVDLDERVWRIPYSKNGRPISIPLLEDELAILRRRKATVKGEWVFPGRAKKPGAKVTAHLVEPKKGWVALCKRAGLVDEKDKATLHLHDLRRSLGSFMVDTGAGLPMIGRALGHQSQAATAIYARLSLEPVREAKAKALDAMRGSSAGGDAHPQ